MKTAGILLASGRSTRLGKAKQLLDWHGRYLINFVIGQIYQSNIDDLYVVLGFQQEKIKELIDRRVQIVSNKDWEKGKSTSISAGLSSLDDDVDAVMFFAVDQPFITSQLINQILVIGEETQKLIVAASVNDVITIPVLYKKDVFVDLLDLQGEEGGKKIMKKYQQELETVAWQDERLMIDIDTETDYRIALSYSKN